MSTTPPSITALPTTPSRNDRTTFNTRAEAFLGALPTFRTELGAVASNAYGNAVDAETSASAAAASQATAAAQASAAATQANAAASSAAASAASAGAAAWVNGNSYAAGAVVWSPANYLVYRRKSAGSGVTDPSADAANWALAAVAVPQQFVTSSNSISASANADYVLRNTGAAQTVTLPASPADGDAVWVTVANGRIDNVVARNGKTIQGLSEDLTIDSATECVRLRYDAANTDWRLH